MTSGSPIVGVMVGTPAVDAILRAGYSPIVGVVVGPVVTSISPPGLVKGQRATW